MNLDEQIALRLPKGSMKRAEKLAPQIAKDPQYAAYGNIKKSLVLRIAVLTGLEELERRYGAKRSGKAAS